MPGPCRPRRVTVAAPLLVMSYVISHRTWGSTVTEALLSRAPPVVSLGGLCSRVIQFLYHTHAASPSSSRQITPASGHPFPPPACISGFIACSRRVCSRAVSCSGETGTSLEGLPHLEIHTFSTMSGVARFETTVSDAAGSHEERPAIQVIYSDGPGKP